MSEYYNLDYTGAEVAADLAKVGDSDSLVEDAAADGTAYARSNGTWAESSIDQLGTVLDAIKGDETGDDLGGKLTDIAESKLLIKKALTDADVADVGDVLRTYAEKIKEALYIEFDLSNGTAFSNPTVVTNYSYMRFKNATSYKVFNAQTPVNTSVTCIDNIEFIDSTTAQYAFAGFSALTTIGKIVLNGVTNASYMFQSCSSLTDVSGLDFPNVTNASYMFQNCSSLTEISGLDFPNVTNASYMFQNCKALIKIDSLDVSSVTSFGSYVFYYCSKLRYLLVKNLGKSSLTSYILSGATNWGVEDDTIPLSAGARQSLIDSLITYSHDRATAGMSACTISLSSTTSALLTKTEIAQITAKGFTIS